MFLAVVSHNSIAEASASLKSDFLKEITTMKKITEGKCPNVVNMVGCCTLQEPLALVQEYVPHGDLLTYLRTVRKLVRVCLYAKVVYCMVRSAPRVAISVILANTLCIAFVLTICF